MGRLKGAQGQFLRPETVPEGSIVSVFLVSEEQAGQRLDLFLKNELRRTSRTRTQAIIAASAFDVEGKRLRANHRLRAEEHVLLWRAPWDETVVPTEIPILFEDEHILAVNKPPLLPVHPTARYHKNTLIKLLQSERPDAFLSLGHRIDRETSGVLIVLKTPLADRNFKMALEGRDDIDKEYVAMTWGIPRELEGQHSYRYSRSLQLDPVNALRVKMRFAEEGVEGALHSATRFRLAATAVGEKDHFYGNNRYALVRCALETGRQHQIRMHLLGLDAPIVGDKLYGPDDRMFARSADGELTEEDGEALEIPRHALHAARMAFNHPISGERVSIFAPLPNDLATFWTGLGGEGNRADELAALAERIDF